MKMQYFSYTGDGTSSRTRVREFTLEEAVTPPCIIFLRSGTWEFCTPIIEVGNSQAFGGYGRAFLISTSSASSDLDKANPKFIGNIETRYLYETTTRLYLWFNFQVGDASDYFNVENVGYHGCILSL